MATIDAYLTEMKACGASELHMVARFPPFLRLSGKLVLMEDQPALTAQSNMEILSEIFSPEQQEFVENNQDFRMTYVLEGIGRFRCDILFKPGGICGYFRLIPDKIPTIDDLELPPILKTIAEHQHGLILVTGPAGSGKSTTLAAMINHINETRPARIITIEDPLEFIHPNKLCLFSQREIGTHAKNFEEALLAASQENPDIIMVGEMQDQETISLAFTCTELDIMVLGTLNANTAADAIDKIISAYPQNQQGQVRSMLAESLKAVIAQQLLKTQDGKGCCVANEILINSITLASIIREGEISLIDSLIQTSEGEGMQSMDQHLIKLIQDGKITKNNAYIKATDKELFL